MLEVKLELYAPYHGTIEPTFQSLPGYTTRQLAANEYWAVCISEPDAGTHEAMWLAPVPADATFPVDTLGTETLPAGTAQFLVSHACIAGGKYIPYIYHPVSPGGQAVGPIPEFPITGDAVQYCVSVTPPGPSGIGIWLVKLDLYHASQLPVKPPGNRWAVFEPPVNTATVTRPWVQPYLVLKGDTGRGPCARVTGLASDRNCYAPGSQGTFTVSVDDASASITAYSWEFKNQDTGQEIQVNSVGNTVQIPFDNTWDAGNWCLTVTAVAGNAASECPVALSFPPPGESFCFGLLGGPCPRIDSLTWAADPQDPCTIVFTVVLSGDCVGKQLQWDFGDGTSEAPQGVTATTMTKSHSYGAPASGAIHVSVDLLGINLACCPAQAQETWIQLPPEGCGGGGGDGGNGGRDGGQDGKGKCGGLIWAAVIALALGLLALGLHPCTGAASGYVFAAGWILLAVYGLLMGIWRVMEWLGICHTSRCEAAAIHMAILGPLGILLGVLAWLVPCFWQPVFWIYAPIVGLWGSIAAECLL